MPRIKIDKMKFTFGGFYSCIYLIPTILIFWEKGQNEKGFYRDRGFYIEFRFLNLNYSLIISFFKSKGVNKW